CWFHVSPFLPFVLLFFCNATPPTAISPLSLHDALPIFPFVRKYFRSDSAYAARLARRSPPVHTLAHCFTAPLVRPAMNSRWRERDRKSTRLNSSHEWISYAVFCLKKKKEKQKHRTQHTK